MKTIATSVIFIFCISLFAQEKGVSPLTSPAGRQETQNSELKTGQTYAVVIGISDYQNDDIPDLRFADKDAEAFAAYLQSPAGGSLPDENIKLLTNEKATMAAVAAELDWLVETAKEGDQAIIYFSGHGDVEAKTARQPGFMLTYDSPPKIYIAGAYPLFYLQLIVETLSSDKNVQTLIITDACRAGKLAGSEIGGTQATAANLAKQYANEIKILSCQPDEFSLEGEQWGGGRGAFSYHLIEGLIGLADKNENGHVNLLEIENYLETVVPEETDPQSQIPMTVGSKGTKVAEVDAGILAKLNDLKAKQLPTLAAIESRGFEETLLANADSSIQKKYEAFIAALEHKNLLDAQEGQPSADDLYRELIQEESLTDLHRFMTRQFATALQDDAQQAINAYLLANPTELEKRWKGDTTYSQYPRYLGRAAELLGESHYMHDYLMAKQLYFEGLNLRLEASGSTNRDSFFQIAIQKQQKALELENRAAYFYNELGVLNTRLKLSEKAIDNFEKAIELAPEWGLPYVNYSMELFYSGQYQKAIEYGEKALEFLPQFPQMYNFLAWIYANDWDWYTKQQWERQGAELSGDLILEEMNIASLAQNLNRLKKGIELLEIAKEIDSTHSTTFLNLGAAYWQLGEYQKAEAALRKAIQIDSLQNRSWYYLGRLLLSQNRTDEGIAALLKNLKLSPNDTYRATAYNSLSGGYRQKEDVQAEIDALKKAIALAPNYGYAKVNLALVYIRQGEFEKAENILLDPLQTDPWHLTTYRHLGSLYERLNRDADAEYIYLKGLEIKADYMVVLNRLLALYAKNGQFDEAIEILRRMLEIEPENILQLAIMESLCFLSGKTLQAEKYAAKVEAGLGYEGRQVRDLALIYHRAKHYEKAIYYFEKNIAVEPDYNWNEYNISCGYALWGKPGQAIHWLSKSLEQGYDNFNHIQTDPDLESIRKEPEFKVLMQKYFPGQVFEGKPAPAENTEPVYYLENCLLLGKYYESEGEYERANFLFEKVIHLKPDTLTDGLAMSLAEAFLKLGNPEAARGISPDQLESQDEAELFKAGKLFYMLGKNKAAETHFDKYMSMSKSTSPHNSVAIFYKNHGEFGLAEPLFETAIEHSPGSMPIRRNFARLYFFSGKKEQAYQVLEEAIRLRPDDLATRGVHCLLSYYDQPEQSKSLFEKAGFLSVWECLELMRQNRYEEADLAWQELQKVNSAWWLEFVKYKYLQMKIRQGETEQALQLFEEILSKGIFVNYQLYKTDQELDPIREMPQYIDLMNHYFPEKTNH